MKKTNQPSENEIREESRRIRRLRLLVDFTISLIYQGNLALPEALKLIENTKAIALSLFPGKEQVYDLIYKPRFERILTEIYGSGEVQ
jgi:hypothetical protein